MPTMPKRPRRMMGCPNLADGGTHEKSKLVSLCHSCHMKVHGILGIRLPHTVDD